MVADVQPGATSPACSEAAAFDERGRHQDAIATLSRAASAGDLAAKRTVGLRILLGDRAPPLGPQGAGLIIDAAEQGDVAAADLASIVIGGGVHCTQDWHSALDWLERAAEGGSTRAQGALGALCGATPVFDEADRWHRMRAEIDLADLLAPPAGRTLHDDPLVRMHPAFAGPHICTWLIARARSRLLRASVYNPDRRRIEQTEERTNSAALFGLLDTDLAQMLVQARIAATVGLPFRNLEPAAVLHYAVGQVFEDHYDFVDPATPDYAQEIARNGQRRVTFLLYLNDDYTGGETGFPHMRLSHRGQAGEGLYFVNALADGRPDLRTLHAGRPPLSGEKWVLSQFIRDRAVVPGTGKS